MSTVIEIEQLNFTYPGGEQVLQDIQLSVEDGEFLGIVGPNAGGKSTLLKILLGLICPDSGKVRVLSNSPTAARSQIGYVPQYPEFNRDFPATVEQVVALGRLGTGSMFGRYGQIDRDIVHRVMRETEIEVLAHRRIGTLSGGQLQRVLVARALACEPKILMLDEPTANIDMRVENDIFDLLKMLNQRMTILVVSHDIAFISGYVHRVACLNRTLICHRTEDLDGQAIQDLYGEDVRMVAHNH